jgi:FkbM family methyltransferase
MSTPSQPVGMPTGAKMAIFSVVDRFAKTSFGQRYLTKAVEVMQTSLGAGNHDYEGDRTGENRLIGALASVIPGFTALDIGANQGSWTLEVLARSRSSRVISVEPGSGPRKVLTERLKGDPRVCVLPYAIGEESGSAVLYGTDRDGAQASLIEDLLVKTTFIEPGREILSETIQIETLASALQSLVQDGFLTDIGHIDVVKIDTEGFELGIFRQVMASLNEGRLAAVQFEFNMHALAQGQLISDFAALVPQGFELFRLTPQTLIPLSHIGANQANFFGFSNWVALSRKRAPEIVAKFEKESGKMRRRSDWI